MSYPDWEMCQKPKKGEKFCITYEQKDTWITRLLVNIGWMPKASSGCLRSACPSAKIPVHRRAVRISILRSQRKPYIKMGALSNHRVERWVWR